MIPAAAGSISDGLGIPRESGDDPMLYGDTLGPIMYSPRERG